jgi:hypothetical protein
MYDLFLDGIEAVLAIIFDILSYMVPILSRYMEILFLCPAALHTIANISIHIFSISLIFLVSGILCILNLSREV